MTIHHDGLLSGIRVLDLSTSWVSAHIGVFFADQGAEVICVEPPGGSPLRRSAAWAFLGRGKHSTIADLGVTEDIERVRRLAGAADVVVETWRPGIAERLGIGYGDLRDSNVGLVYTSVSGFGSRGPLADVPGHEALVMAKVGISQHVGGITTRPGPAYCSVPYATFSAAQTALHGTLAALYERERSGRGQHVESSLVQGLAAHDPWSWFLALIARKYPEAFAGVSAIGDDGIPNHSFAFRLLVALTADGHWLQFSQTMPHLFSAFMRALELDWMFNDPKWSTAPEFEDRDQRREFWELMLTAARSKTLAQWQQIFDDDPDVWAEVFRSGAELLDHPQLVHDDRVITIDDPRLGPVRQPGPLVAGPDQGRVPDQPAPQLGNDTASSTWPTSLTQEASKGISEKGTPEDTTANNTAENAATNIENASLEYTTANNTAENTAASEGDTLKNDTPNDTAGSNTSEDTAVNAPPLDGVTLVEFGTFYAAPFAGAILADFGARVIKIESLAGEPMRTIVGFPEAGAAKSMQGKQSIAVDLATEEGRSIAHRLAASADMVLQSYRAGVAQRLGVDGATLTEINPDLVYLSSPGYGPGEPCGNRPAFAPTIGAGAGAGWRNAGPTVISSDQLDLDGIMETSLRLGTSTQSGGNADGCSALAVASALLAGLLNARRNGGGRNSGGKSLATSMLATMSHVLYEDCVDYEQRPPTRVADAGLHGLSAVYRLYPAEAGWVFLAVPTQREWQRFIAALEALGDATRLSTDPRFVDPVGRAINDDALVAELTEIFAQRTAADWEQHLTASGVGCVEVLELPLEAFLLNDAYGRAAGMVDDVEHPTFGVHPRLTALAHLSRSPTVLGRGCLLGEHTDQILEGLGYTPGRIAELRAREVIGGN